MVALADCTLGYATTRVGPEGTGGVSLSLHLDYRRPPPPIGSRISCSAQAWQLDHGFAYGEGQILDANGAVLASASLRSLAVPTSQMAFTPGGRGRRPAKVPTLAAATTSGRPNEAVRRSLAPLLETELAQLCSLEVISAAEGAVELSALPPEAFHRTAGVVHGGAIGLLAHLGLAGALPIAHGGRLAPRRLDLHVDYLRPAAVGRPVVLRARVAHRSRKVAVITGEIASEDGRLLVFGRETCLLAAPENDRYGSGPAVG
jgi:uncharacterized protein (TIGR00369 family)